MQNSLMMHFPPHIAPASDNCPPSSSKSEVAPAAGASLSLIRKSAMNEKSSHSPNFLFLPQGREEAKNSPPFICEEVARAGYAWRRDGFPLRK